MEFIADIHRHGRSPSWLQITELLDRFGSTEEKARSQHQAFVEAGQNLPGWSPFEVAIEGFILGSKKLLRQMLTDSDPAMTKLGKGIQWSKLYSPDDIVEILGAMYGVSPQAIRSKQRPATALRIASMSLSRRHTTWSLSRLGRFFGGISYGAVANSCRRCEQTVTDSSDEDLKQILTPFKA